MMLRNIFTKTLRDNLAGILAWGGGLAALLAIGASQYTQLMGGIGPERQKIAEEFTKAFQAFGFLIGEITSLDTMGGFITTRVLGFVPVFVGMWVAITAAGLIRGEEQTGALDALLATPHSRHEVLWQKLGGLGLGLLVMVALMMTGLALGVAISGESLPADGLVFVMLNILAIAAFWAVVGLLVSQFTITRRPASGITSGLMFGSYLLNNILGAIPGLEWSAWLMPFHYYSVSKPLVPGRIMEWGAWAVLVVATGVLLSLVAMIFVRRDIGSVMRLLGAAKAQKEGSGRSAWLLGSVFAKNVRDLVWPVAAWSVGLAAYCVMLIATTNQTLGPIRDMMKNVPMLALLAGNLATAEAFLSFALFIYLPILLAVFSITQVISWADDEEDGRLELLASAPLPRVQILLGKYMALLLAILVIVGVTGGAMMLSAATSGVELNSGKLVGALVAIVPPTFAVGAFGLCAATWRKRPSTAVPITVGLVAVMFVLELFAPILNLPEAVLNLSVFHLYGRPLSDGVKWGNIAMISVVAIALFAGSLVGMNRRDVAK